MFKEGDLIGIANDTVYFVGSVKEAEGFPVVYSVSGYRPVDSDTLEKMRNMDYVINEDPYGEFHDYWKEAVKSDRTEQGYEEFAEDLWYEEDQSEEYERWFYGQDCSGEGYVLIEDDEVHNKVKKDMEHVTGRDVGSWEWSCYMSVPTVTKGSVEELIEWDIIYNRDAVEGCWRYWDAVRRGVPMTAIK